MKEYRIDIFSDRIKEEVRKQNGTVWTEEKKKENIEYCMKEYQKNNIG